MKNDNEFLRNIRAAIRHANRDGFVGTAEALKALELTARLEVERNDKALGSTDTELYDGASLRQGRKTVSVGYRFPPT